MQLPSFFLRHGGNLLKKFTGLTHDNISFDKQYTYADIPGKIIWKSESEDLMVLGPQQKITLTCRAMVVPNPELFKVGTLSCPTIVEDGDEVICYLRGYEGYFEELELDYLFRIYFVR